MASKLLTLSIVFKQLKQNVQEIQAPPCKTLTFFFQISFPGSLNKESVGKENDLESQLYSGHFFKVFYHLARVDMLGWS